MKTHEISELLQLKGWTRTKLAVELGLTENAIHRWFSGDGVREVKGPAAILMHQWLDRARAEARKQPA